MLRKLSRRKTCLNSSRLTGEYALVVLCVVLTLASLGCVNGQDLSEESEVSTGFPCSLIPNFCDRVTCLPPQECEGGIVVKGGGNCGCCDVCVRYTAAEGEPCKGSVPDPAVIPANTFSQYYDYSDVCQQNLYCPTGTNPTCKEWTSTDANPDECLEMQTDPNVAKYTQPPQCDFYGDFAFKRCKGLEGDNPRCFCVDKSGTTVFGRLPIGSDNVTCACSRAVAEYGSSSEAGRFIRCVDTGDFSELQCINGVCFCINKLTARITSSAVNLKAFKALPCYDSSIYGDSFYTICVQEYIKLTTILKEFEIKGIDVRDIDTSSCDPDGTYAPVQDSGDKWYCADKEGVQLLSYVTQSSTDRATMLCNCARDQAYPDGLPDNARGRDCVPDGNYRVGTAKCVDERCYCVDDDGQRASCDFQRIDDVTTMKCPISDCTACTCID